MENSTGLLIHLEADNELFEQYFLCIKIDKYLYVATLSSRHVAKKKQTI